jgi:hypothetical protein
MLSMFMVDMSTGGDGLKKVREPRRNEAPLAETESSSEFLASY